MTEELRTLLVDVKAYIEKMTRIVEEDWGSWRSLDKIKEQGEMPEIYSRVESALANQED